MRVLHLYSGNLYGGIETLLGTLARAGGAVRHEFGLCFPGRLRDELVAAGAAVYDLGAVRVRRPWTVWQARRRLARLLRQETFAAVVCHAPWPHALFAPVARRTGVPVAFWAHDVHTGRHWLERWAARTPPDLALANSRFTRAALPTLFPGVPAEVLYLPLAPAVVEDPGAVRAEVRRELGTPADAVVILQACRLEEWKGHTLLLDALARLRDLPGWACWVAGGPQRPHEQAYLDRLRARAAAAGLADRVRFLGQRRDVPRLLAAADVHCQPNTGPEPFGLAFVEALAAGRPVVTTALGGALEIVDETCGVLTPPGDAPALAEALRRLIGDPTERARLGAAGPARARHLCSVQGQTDRLGELLAGLAQGQPA